MQIPSGVTIEPCNEKNIKTIAKGIDAYNLSKVPALTDMWTRLDFIAKDKNGIEIGGVIAGIGYWNGLDIKVLWVAESHRNKGIGSLILNHLEKIAKEKGATISLLDTFNFQAEGFYLKNGYIPFGELEGFPEGCKRIYFSKKLI